MKSKEERMQNVASTLAVVPVSVAAGFAIHWLTIRRIGTAEERLPHCRGAYLAFSLIGTPRSQCKASQWH